MNLAGDSIDDIPDRATLRRLLQRLETEAAPNHRTRREAGETWEPTL